MSIYIDALMSTRRQVGDHVFDHRKWFRCSSLLQLVSSSFVMLAIQPYNVSATKFDISRLRIFVIEYVITWKSGNLLCTFALLIENYSTKQSSICHNCRIVGAHIAHLP